MAPDCPNEALPLNVVFESSSRNLHLSIKHSSQLAKEFLNPPNQKKKKCFRSLEL